MKKVVQIISLIYFIIFFISCKKHVDKPVVLTAINEMQSCEEENIFYKIISIENDSDYDLLSRRDSLVLFLFSKNLDVDENYSLFYPAVSKERLKIKVKGYFLKRKIPNNHSYGCYGSSIFRILKIIKIDTVTEKENFSINNN